MYIYYNLHSPHLKMKCHVLVYIKIYGGNINVCTMCTLCEYYQFPKNNENCTVYKMLIFDQSWKC